LLILSNFDIFELQTIRLSTKYFTLLIKGIKTIWISNDVLRLVLCCSVKIPIEATAETIGSVINSHGSKNRSSLLPKALSNEVQVAWNGPSEFSNLTTSLIKESLECYFQTRQTGTRFYARTRLNLMSNTVAEYMRKLSRFLFSA
jgi:hypothetical protein